MLYLKKIPLAILALFFLYSCDSKQSNQSTEINNTSWVLHSIQGTKVSEVDISLEFAAERISGKGICNRYFANYKLNKQQIIVESVGATKMMCPEQAALEDQYLMALQNAQTWSIDNQFLTIKTSDGDLVFKHAGEISSMDTVEDSPDFSGQYYTVSTDEYWQSLTIYPGIEEDYQVVFSARTVGGEPACYFQGDAYVEGTRLMVSLPKNEEHIRMQLSKSRDTIRVFTEEAADRLALLYYCSGGASLAGTYIDQPGLVLSENKLGTFQLVPGTIADEKILTKHFPDWLIEQRTGQRDGPIYTYYELTKGKEAIQLTVGKEQGQAPEELSSIAVSSQGIPDQFGTRTEMTFSQAKRIRPNLQLVTDAHFHTYAVDSVSRIRYEICCNTDQVDKTDWSEKEVDDWKVKSIIWDANSIGT